MHVNMFLIVSHNQAFLIENIYEPNAVKPAIALDLGSAVICIVFSHARYWEGIQASFTDIYFAIQWYPRSTGESRQRSGGSWIQCDILPGGPLRP